MSPGRIEMRAGVGWHPLYTTLRARPEPADLIAHTHAVWRVVKVTDEPLNDDDRQTWLDRPYRVHVRWVAGAKPEWMVRDPELACRTATIRIPAGAYYSWQVYHTARWPQCSCCGEPMPCRAELEDREVTASLDRVAELEGIPPGACWACREPITQRQRAVVYPGENLDLPGGQQPRFHTRTKCRPSARRYEERWLAVDPRRERILTWPHCDGILVVHADGSSECVPGRSPLDGRQREPQPDCRGHLTHDHTTVRACYVGEDYLRPREWGGCPRGCDPHNHAGTATTPRPERRMPEQGVIP